MAEETGKQEELVCVFCDATLENNEEANFCHVCGGEIHDVSAEKLLDIKIDTDDIETYIFQGHITRTLKVRSGIFARMKTLNGDESKRAMMEADAEIAEHGAMAQDTMVFTRNEHMVKLMLIGIGSENSNDADKFKLPAHLGRELLDLLVHKAGLLQRALNIALQTDKVTDF